MINWHAFLLSLQVTAVASVLILSVGLLLAFVLLHWRWPGRALVETVINMPLVLPPTVVGYYLLLALGRGSFLFETLRLRVLFSWRAAAIAAAVVGLPLMVQAARAALAEVDPEIENAGRLDGASRLQILWHITLPMARRGILAGFLLGSLRALGDFGTTLMVAGNIPGRTQTLPLAIYDAVQNRQYDTANLMVLVMSVVAFSGMWLLYRLVLPEPKTSQ